MREGLKAGANGWSAQVSCAVSIQRDYDGTPMVTDLLSDEEILAFGEVLAETGQAAIEINYSARIKGEAWQRELMQVDARVRTAPRTVVFFEIQRDGSLRNIRVAQSSGNSSVDYAALRAVTNSNPVPALPSDLGKSSVSTEVSFILKR